MKIGVDIESRNIIKKLLRNNEIVNYAEKPIYSDKRDSNSVIMEKTLGLISELYDPQVKSIGVSLPSTIDKKKGIVYDLEKIPYWKEMKIKKIIEDQFNIPTFINNDINCYALGEKEQGLCQGFKDILCITLDENVGTSIIVNDRLFLENNYSFVNSKCLSSAIYNAVRNYKKHYMKTVEDLTFICRSFNDEIICIPTHKSWNELGIMTGRLISILLSNYDPQIIVLGGKLAKSYQFFAEPMDRYLEKYIHPQILLNMIIVTSIINNPKTVGAANLMSVAN